MARIGILGPKIENHDRFPEKANVGFVRIAGRRRNTSLPGGQVMVSWRGGTEPVWRTGNAERVSEGFIDL